MMTQDINQLLNEIAADTRYTASYTGRDALSPRVMQAMAEVDREQFVADRYRVEAWANCPLPIGQGQTISQPFIVALMTDLLEPQAGDRVLEIGTGSGYQAAVLSRLVKQVYSIERIPELADSAGKRLKELGYSNVQTRCDDGSQGWPEAAPFDSIIVTAAAEQIPPALLNQLKPGGRMAIPVGMAGSHQELLLVTREESDAITTRHILGVAFVPLLENQSDNTSKQ